MRSDLYSICPMLQSVYTRNEWNYDKDHVHIMFKAQPKTELTKFIHFSFNDVRYKIKIKDESCK
ncbi:hypothetical protein A5847_002555 [Enterococcus faecium]|nr:hypothetical protein A5847_002554 [Enterococcus faecium]OTO82655.1 hypothetical protein A5847_002555 [Enterococcus faecium]